MSSSEPGPLHFKVKAAIAVAVLGVVALVVFTTVGVVERRRERRAWDQKEHLEDTATVPSKADYDAWRAELIFVLQMTPGKSLELVESWAGDPPMPAAVDAVRFLETSRPLPVWEGSGQRAIRPSRVVVFQVKGAVGPSDLMFGVVQEGVFYWHDNGASALKATSRLCEDGPEAPVKRRLQHVFAVREALRATPSRAGALAPFLQSDVWTASHTALHRLAECGPDQVSVLRKFLLGAPPLGHRDKAIELLVAARGPNVVQDLCDVLRHELVFWKEIKPSLKAGWYTPGTDTLLDRHRALRDTLGALRQLGDKSCKDAVLECLDLYDSLPSYGGYDENDGVKNEARQLRVWLAEGARHPDPPPAARGEGERAPLRSP